jgi:meiotically up-regulated gene 157 (Mug157) protein
MIEVNWWILGIVAFCTIILLAYLIWKNIKDEKEVAKSFYDEVKTEKHETDDEEI